MTKKDFMVFCVASVFGGIMVGIGGVGLLFSLQVFSGAMGKLVGALIFSLAMFVVTTFGLYLATGLSFGKTEWDADERLIIVKMPPEVLYEKILSGEITDGKTMAALMKYKLLKEQEKPQ